MGKHPGELAILILAAGKGTRMKSRRAKVLHPLAGRPMLGHVLAVAESLRPQRSIVVVGRDADGVREAFAGRAEFVLQAEQRGTGHAVRETQAALEGFAGDVLILYGDTPLLRAETLRGMLARKAETGADLVMLSAPVDVPGIVIRDASGGVARIVEATDATPEELLIQERNTGVYLLGVEQLWKTLAQLDDDNEQGELYLTDIVELSVREGGRVETLQLEGAEEALGVNTRAELAQAAATLRRRTCERLMDQGVAIVDPGNTFIDCDVEIGRDSLIEPGCVIQGDTKIGENVHLKPHCVVESSRVGDDAILGPSAHLRPGSVLGRGVRIGNFVEVKNSVLGDGVKADHLSYIGDADVGPGASFGCGSIVVNYDGRSKHRTTVGARAFIGCNVNLIAPVVLEDDCFVAAGSTITHEVPRKALAVARAKQRNVEGWVDRRPQAAATARARKTASPAGAGGAARKAKAGGSTASGDGRKATAKEAAKRKTTKRSRQRQR